MSNFNLTTLRRIGATVAARNSWRARSIVTAAPRPVQGATAQREASTACDQAKKGVNEIGNKAERLKNQGKSDVEDATQKTKDAANKLPDNAKDICEKAKKTAQDAWEAAKDGTQKLKDTVVGKEEQTKEAVKKSAESVKQGMNSKN